MSERQIITISDDKLSNSYTAENAQFSRFGLSYRRGALFVL